MMKRLFSDGENITENSKISETMNEHLYYDWKQIGKQDSQI